MKDAYLTIDDRPSEDLKTKVDFLTLKAIPAVLFCEGARLEQQAEAAIYAINKGFTLGNHSYDHPSFSAIGTDQSIFQIERTEKIIEQLYIKANRACIAKYFRFPYGHTGNALNKSVTQKTLTRLGYTRPRFENVTYAYFKGLSSGTVDWLWTYDVQDWRLKTEPNLEPAVFLSTLVDRMKTNQKQG